MKREGLYSFLRIKKGRVVSPKRPPQLEQAVNEWRGGGASEHDQESEEDQDENDRPEPPFFVGCEETPQLGKNTAVRGVTCGFEGVLVVGFHLGGGLCLFSFKTVGSSWRACAFPGRTSASGSERRDPDASEARLDRSV